MAEDNHYEVSKKSKEEIKAIKDDIKDIAKRVGNLKGEALSALYEDSDELMSSMSEMKDKIVGQSQGNLKNMYSCVEKNPMKTAMYCFGAGVILAMLLRK
jgi:ElaB/YqjD/DUF883 family membrane-anchored ribosome-binding protein